LNDKFYYLSTIFVAILFFISLVAYYVIISVEDSFHYQRVREIIYVLETATLAKVDSSEDRERLWNEKCCTSDSRYFVKVENEKFKEFSKKIE